MFGSKWDFKSIIIVKERVWFDVISYLLVRAQSLLLKNNNYVISYIALLSKVKFFLHIILFKNLHLRIGNDYLNISLSKIHKKGISDIHEK